MARKHLWLLLPAFAFSIVLPRTADANLLERASASVGCSGYDLTAVATDLSPGTEYTIDYRFVVTVQGARTPITGAIAFTPAADKSVATRSGSWSLAADFTTITGSATLTSSGSTVPTIINGSTRKDGSAVFNCAPGSWSQDGPKLVGKGVVSVPGFAAEQGNSASLAADGNTAVTGGPGDNRGTGAVWVFTRTGGRWRQEGAKLVGAGAVGAAAGQGYSVALAADGNTVIAGGPLDHPTPGGVAVGAAWVFARTARVWDQQAKLVGAGAVGAAQQGWSVALSADGNTAIVGGPGDGGDGAVWVFTRAGGGWRQQGPKLVGRGAVGNALQGTAVALSADGNTALVGGSADNAGVGAAWVFVRAAGAWRQAGPKLVGSDAVGAASQGAAVALSADGRTAIVGGPRDNGVGAAWVFTRAGAAWRQQGAKLVGRHAIGFAGEGAAVALSADGDSAILGGFGDNDGVGAAWGFGRVGRVWRQQGPKLVGTGTVGAALLGASLSLSGDGTTAVIGGPGDDRTGALRIFAVAAPGFAGMPGEPDCYAEAAAALVRRFHGLAAAAAGLGFPGTAALERAVLQSCRE